MSFVTATMKEDLKDHILEEALPFGKGFLAYYMKRPGTGRIMSTLVVFTPEGMALLGDLTPERHGSISALGYGIGWFGSEKSEYYLCEKFLQREYQPEVAARWVREHIEEMKKDREAEDLERLPDWEELLSDLDGDGMGADHFHEALQGLGYEHEDEGYEYNLRAAGWLCAIQQKFSELCSKVPALQSSSEKDRQ